MRYSGYTMTHQRTLRSIVPRAGGERLLLGAVARLAFCDESPALRHGVDQTVLTQ